MAKFVSISGPSHSGKSTLVNILRSSLSDNPNVIVSESMQDRVWESIISLSPFKEYKEITSDRDYLMMYVFKLVGYYKDLIHQYEGFDGTVILDECYHDLLIYSMLNFWYHYPAVEHQQALIRDLIGTKDKISMMYLVKADDVAYPPDKRTLRSKMASFKRCRPLELDYYYTVFKDLPNTVMLPSANVLDCEFFILEDMKSKGLL